MNNYLYPIQLLENVDILSLVKNFFMGDKKKFYLTNICVVCSKYK